MRLLPRRAAAACTCRALAAFSRSSPVLWPAVTAAPRTLSSAQSLRAWLAARPGRVTRLRLDLRSSAPALARRAALCCAVCPAVAPGLQRLELFDRSGQLTTGRGLAGLTALRSLLLGSSQCIQLSADLADMAFLRQLRLVSLRAGAGGAGPAAQQTAGWEADFLVNLEAAPGCFPPSLTALVFDRVSLSGLQPNALAGCSRLTHLAVPMDSLRRGTPVLQASAGQLPALRRVLIFCAITPMFSMPLRTLYALVPEPHALEEFCIDQAREADAALAACR